MKHLIKNERRFNNFFNGKIASKYTSKLSVVLSFIIVKLVKKCKIVGPDYDIKCMVPYILGVNYEIGAHVQSNLCYLIYIWHLIRSVTKIGYSKRLKSLHAGATCSVLQSNIRTMSPNSDIKGRLPSLFSNPVLRIL